MIECVNFRKSKKVYPDYYETMEKVFRNDIIEKKYLRAFIKEPFYKIDYRIYRLTNSYPSIVFLIKKKHILLI